MLALLNPIRLMMAGTVSESRFNLFHPVAPVARTDGALFERRGSRVQRLRHVRFTPNSGHSSVQVECPKSAISGHAPSLRLLT
jgi:hypothetical protein